MQIVPRAFIVSPDSGGEDDFQNFSIFYLLCHLGVTKGKARLWCSRVTSRIPSSMASSVLTAWEMLQLQGVENFCPSHILQRLL